MLEYKWLALATEGWIFAKLDFHYRQSGFGICSRLADKYPANADNGKHGDEFRTFILRGDSVPIPQKYGRSE